MRAFLLAFVAPSLLLLSGGVARADEWKEVSNKKGMLIERRPVPGSRFYELRVSTHSALSAERIGRELWNDRPDGKIARTYRKKREVLQSSDNERVVYEQVRTPVISNRDYTARLRRSHDPTTGVYRLTFQVDNAAGPPPVDGIVRIENIRGAWTVTPASDGGSDIVYVVLSEPGGTLPAWMVHGAQVDSARDLVNEVLQYAAK